MCTYMPVTGLAPRESLQWGERSIKAHTVIGEMDWTKKICPESKVECYENRVERIYWLQHLRRFLWERSDLKVTEKPGKNKERKTLTPE